MTYIKVFVDWRKAIEPLDDAERGRLFTALLDYADSGKTPKLDGNERFLFPMLQSQLDRDAAAYDTLCQTNRESGKLGGRPPKNRAVFSETEKTQEKDKDKGKEKDKDKDSSWGAGAPRERKMGRKKAPASRRESPEEIEAGRRRMERFLLELRQEAAEQDRRQAELDKEDGDC